MAPNMGAPARVQRNPSNGADGRSPAGEATVVRDIGITAEIGGIDQRRSIEAELGEEAVFAKQTAQIGAHCSLVGIDHRKIRRVSKSGNQYAFPTVDCDGGWHVRTASSEICRIQERRTVGREFRQETVEGSKQRSLVWIHQ